MANIEINLSNYLDECIETIQEKGYIVSEENSIQQKLSDYVENMKKNLYSYSKCEQKTYKEIFEDLEKILEENE